MPSEQDDGAGWRIVKTTDAARRLGVSRYQVLRWIRAGELPAQRIGRDYWVRVDAICERVGCDDPTHRHSTGRSST